MKASVEKAELKVGETTKATATIMPEGAEGVELAWTSSDDKIATVDKDGNVKAVAEGKSNADCDSDTGKRRQRGNKNSYCGCNGNKRRRNRSGTGETGGTYRRESVS